MMYYDNPYSNLLHKRPHQECVECVMDTSDPDIKFDQNGVCNHCIKYKEYTMSIGDYSERRRKLDALVERLKAKGRGRDYDCIMGLSGGVDSSYLAWYAVKKLGLRPLVVHVDTGWNSELAVNNIQNIVQKLDLDLHTLVIDWPEIKDLQRAYFLSGVANLDVPQDHAFIASLYNEAKKYGISDILNGGNMQTESILPSAWGYDASDPTSLIGIHKRFGKLKRLKRYPIHSTFSKFIYYPFIAKMRTHRPLELIEYNKQEAKNILVSEMGWRDYGGKHYESVFTKFFQAHYLPYKFGYDKRKAHLSSLIVSGQISREEAVKELLEPLYSEVELREDRQFFMKKLDIDSDTYERIMSSEPVSFSQYPNNVKLYSYMRKYLGIFSSIYKRFK
ncbi:N-acetyl sugar amidotransferase [Pseudidiomarina aestuarii]|nr:N-acetyl sugar amidotransferase [Pseudidiomarina aestuarii]